MKFIVLVAAMLVSHFLLAQDTTELVRRNGFKTIHLGGSIDSIKGARFKKEILEKDEFPASLYEIDDAEYKTIGEVKVKEIKAKTYKSKIYQINVITEKDPRVITALEKSFGKAMYINRQLAWKWGASVLTLTFYAHKNNLELVYKSHPVVKQMYTDKGKKLDGIAEGF